LVIGFVAMTNKPTGLGQCNLVLRQAREVRHVLYETFSVIYKLRIWWRCKFLLVVSDELNLYQIV